MAGQQAWLWALLPLLVPLVHCRMLLSDTGQPCQQAPMGNLELFPSFNNTTAISARGQQLSRGTCAVWNMTINEQCSQMNSMLLVELWLTDKGRVIDRTRTVDGVYLLSNSGQSPKITIYSNGDVGVENYNPYTDGQPPQPDNHFLDLQAIDDALPYQRVLIPAGQLNEDILSLTLITALALPSTQGYILRASCVAAMQLPCPRAGPDSNPRGCSNQGSCGPASAPNSSGPTCTCNQGYADPACATHIVNLTGNPLSSSAIKSFNLPGQTWTYFAVTGQPHAETRLLVELTKQPSSANVYEPSLIVTNRGLPGVSDIEPASGPQATCTCTNCNCEIPDEALNLLYEERLQEAGSDGPVTWYIGVYNNLPYGLPNNSDPYLPLTLTSRWSSGTQPSPPLCPADCSGQGQCNMVQTPVVQDPNAPAPFSCTCQPGFGGPYCQGPLRQLQLTGSGFDSGSVTLLPGQWQFYTLMPPPTSGQVVLNWAPDTILGTTNLLLVFSPIYSATSGNQYQIPPTTFTWNNTVSFPLPMPTAMTTGWSIAVLNSNVAQQTNSSYRLIISEPAPSQGMQFSSLLQMALIGSVSALALVFLAFLVAKVILLRRFTARAAAREAAADLEMQQRLAHVTGGNGPGVPAQLVQTFPRFAYNAATFAAMVAKAPPISQREPGANGRALKGLASPQAGTEPLQVQHVAVVVQASYPDAGVAVADGLDDKHLTVCSICIADYEEGDCCRQLPCGHTFHTACIDAWMTQHVTCPNCRWHLVPTIALPVDAVDGGAPDRRLPLARSQVQPVLGTTDSADHILPASVSPDVEPAGDACSVSPSRSLTGDGAPATSSRSWRSPSVTSDFSNDRLQARQLTSSASAIQIHFNPVPAAAISHHTPINTAPTGRDLV